VLLVRHTDSSRHRFSASVLTLGNFDGVHRGHQAILARVNAEARSRGAESVALTFHPHPLAVLKPEHAPPLLTSLRDRLTLLRETGVDVVVLRRFTQAFAAWSAERFVEELLVRRLHAVKLVVGHSVSFGHARRGNAALLESLAQKLGFELEVVGPVRVGEHDVSSSGVRRAVAAGDVRLAAALLGRPHRLTGRIVHGQHRGAGLGFPTANVAVRAGLHPPDGVYAVRADVGGRRVDGVANVGRNPTFGAHLPRSLEVHLFDVNADLYGARCTVHLVERLRGEMKFGSVEALVDQIRRDAAEARRILAAG
jgi:riboflavin kinase/FMN adenylyltransferase